MYKFWQAVSGSCLLQGCSCVNFPKTSLPSFVVVYSIEKFSLKKLIGWWFSAIHWWTDVIQIMSSPTLLKLKHGRILFQKSKWTSNVKKFFCNWSFVTIFFFRHNFYKTNATHSSSQDLYEQLWEAQFIHFSIFRFRNKVPTSLNSAFLVYRHIEINIRTV